MTAVSAGRISKPGPVLSGLPTASVARWLVGLRVVAASALLVGALLVQSTTEEILPIGPLARVAGLTYVLSLVWIALWMAGIPAGLHGGLQITGDLVIVATIIYLTGGVWSPFPFLFLVTVGVAALMFGLGGALTAAAAAFVVYGTMVFALVHHLIPPAGVTPQMPQAGSSGLVFQLGVTGVGFALVALLTSYLAHSLQLAETQLRGAHQATARLMALSDDIVRSVDSGVIATKSDGSVLLANPAAVRILASSEPLEGRRLEDLLPLATQDWASVLQAATAARPTRFEDVLVGSGRPVGITVTPLSDADSATLGHVVHFRDLTQAREEARRELLRERLAAVGEMAAGIAHEIRNPLASISGSAQVLGKAPALDDADRRLLRIIVEESRRLSGIVEAFLGYARPPEPSLGPCDIARTLEDTLDLFANSHELTAHHRVERDIRPLPAPVVADEGRLRQAFFNLARNAVQAMPQGGTMRVQAAVESGSYTIRWSDEGVGMSTQQIEEIFQPFKAFRKGGTGLGLAVVYSIISDHGGEIQVESAPGQGCSFTLRIPLDVA